MASNYIKLSELNNRLESQLKLIQSLEQELNDLKTANQYEWRLVIKQYLSNIRDHIEDLGDRQTELQQNNLLLKHNIHKLNTEIDELTIARRKLSGLIKSTSSKPIIQSSTPKHEPTILPTTRFPKSMQYSSINSSAIHPNRGQSQQIRPPWLESMKPLPDIFNHKNWRFESLKNAMADSAQIEKISQQLGIHNLPEMVFPNSYLKLSFKVKCLINFILCKDEYNKMHKKHVQHITE